MLKYHTGDDEVPEVLYSTILQKYLVFCDNEFTMIELETVEDYQAVILGRPHAEVREFLEQMVSRFRLKIKSFSQMDLSEIALHTGLDAAQAALAADRMFSEPFIAEEIIDKLDEIVSNYIYI